MFTVAFKIIDILSWEAWPEKFLADLILSRTYGLLTKCELKMAGYWPSSFFACLWTEAKSRSINSQKKNEANIQPSWPNLEKFRFRDTAGSPERARWLYLARSGSQSHRVIWFILPARGACHIIKCNFNLVTKSWHKITCFNLQMKHTNSWWLLFTTQKMF